MIRTILLLSAFLTQENLSWIGEILRRYTMPNDPGGQDSAGMTPQNTCTLYLTEDALYSLCEAELLQEWLSILTLPGVDLVCDNDALIRRGMMSTPVQEQYPDRVTVCSHGDQAGLPTFWNGLILQASNNDRTGTKGVGWLETSSPYMHGSPWLGIQCLSAAISAGCDTSLFAYLDGCHTLHIGQTPEKCANVGATIEALGKEAEGKDLSCTILVNRACASARGYMTWEDGQGTVVSLFTLRSAHIRNLEILVRSIKDIPLLLAGNAGVVRALQTNTSGQAGTREPPPPSVLIFITHSPYHTEHAYGGIALAAACAYQGIETQVVFCGDGIYALTGEHRPVPGSAEYMIPDLLAVTKGTPHLRFFALGQSFQKRGLIKDSRSTAVTEIGYPELSTFFTNPSGNGDFRQRILFF